MLKIAEELTPKQKLEQETVAYWEAQWQAGACAPRRTQEALALLPPTQDKEIVDLGCGNGELLRHIKDAHCTGFDISPTALALCPDHITTKQGLLPYTRLPENHFDIVICTDTIAELPPHLHRLFLSEAAALLKRDGHFLCSTPLDTKTLNPLGHFKGLIETEFEILKTKTSGFFSTSHVILLCKKKGLGL